MYLVYFLKLYRREGDPIDPATLMALRELFTTVTEAAQPTWATHMGVVRAGSDPGFARKLEGRLDEMLGVMRYQQLVEGTVVAN